MSTSASVIYLPLVKANAFIGLEQFNERKQTIFEEAVRLSLKSNSKRSFDDSSDSDRPNGVGDEDLSPKKKQRFNAPAVNSKRKFEEPSPLVRCNAIIGLELLSANVKHMHDIDRMNAAFGSVRPSKRRRRDVEPTSTADRKRKPNESFQLYRCNEAIVPDLFSENWEQAIETTMLELPNTSYSFMNDSQSFTKAVVAKSKKMQLWNVIGSKSLPTIKQRRNIARSWTNEPSTLVRCNAVVGPALLLEKANENTMLAEMNTPIPMNGSESFTNAIIAKSKEMELPISDCNMKPQEPSTLVRCNAIIGLGLLAENWEQSNETTAIETTTKEATANETTTNESPASPPAGNNKTFTSAAIVKSRQMQRKLPIQRLIRMQEAIQEWNANFGTQYTIM